MSMQNELLPTEASIFNAANSSNAAMSMAENTNTPIDTIVHLGAGKCRELEQHLSLGAARIVLVEADSILVDELSRRTSAIPSIELIHQAISDKDVECVFHRYNQPDVNSLQSPEAKLIELFPGLRPVGEETVSTMDLDKLLSSLKIRSETQNRLIVDIPGAELSILEVLRRDTVAPLFTQISWTLSNEPLYENSSSKPELVAKLEELGYDLIEELPTLDSQFIHAEFRLNTFKIENRSLRRELSDLQFGFKQLTTENQQLKQLSSSLNKSVEEAHAFSEDLQQQLSKLQEAEQTQVEQAKELKAQLQSTEQSLYDKSNTLDESHATIETLRLQLSERDEGRQAQEQTIDNLKSQLHSVEQAFQQNSNALNETHSTVETLRLELAQQHEVVQHRAVLIENLTNDKELAEKVAEENFKILENLRFELKQQKEEQTQAETRVDEIQSINIALKNQLLDIEQHHNEACHKIEKIALYVQEDHIVDQPAPLADNDISHPIEADTIRLDPEQKAIINSNETQISSTEHEYTSSYQDLNPYSRTLAQLNDIDTTVHKQRSENKRLQQKLTEYAHSEGEQSSQLIEARSTINLLTQLVTLRDNDLRDLQSQYSELTDVCREQAKAINTIEEKLNFAANQLTIAKSKKRAKKKSSKLKKNVSF